MTERLSKNLTREEMECECGCEFDTVDYVLVTTLQDVVDHFTTKYKKARLLVTGGNRCEAHNDAVQLEYNPDYVTGSSNSQHIYGKAADFKIEYYLATIGWQQVPAAEVYDYLDAKYPNTHGVGLYSNRCHVDSRGYKARW